jgi:aspartate aminotransferase
MEDLEPYFEAQDRFERLRSHTFRRFGAKVSDFSYANAYMGPDSTVLAALDQAIKDNRDLSFQYTPYGGRTITRRFIASKLIEEYGLSFNFRDIILTPGAMAALNTVFRALFGPDDEILLLSPCWLDYPLYLGNLGIRFRFVELGENKRLDLSRIAQAIGKQTRGILFSHPSCPTGVLYSKDEIEGLANVLAYAEKQFQAPIYWISDEVHRHIIWSRSEFHGPLHTYPRSLSVYSFGKALFLQGQRIGYIAVSPNMPEREQLRDKLVRCVQMMGFCTPTNLMQRAICDLLTYRPRLGLIADHQAMVRERLSIYGYEVCPADATFFVYVKSPLPDDFQFAQILADRGVLVLPSTLFHEKGFFRISVTARSDSIMAGLPVFESVLKRRKESQDARVPLDA